MDSNVQSHRELSDQDFIKHFEDCTLVPRLFSHEAHIRLAWITLQEHELDEAIEKIKRDILRFVDYVGAGEKYNATLTTAAIYILHRLIKKSQQPDFETFLSCNCDLLTDFKSLVLKHYKTNIFTSKEAKERFLPPDKNLF